ncbi:MAG: hypothetical protein IT328_21055 [Caldilineaceae bacterium]|nr:hypothetical protein [Caldilineaceae bacterium]
MGNRLCRTELLGWINSVALRVVIVVLIITMVSDRIATRAWGEEGPPTPTPSVQSSTASGGTIFMPLIQNPISAQASLQLPPDRPELGQIYSGLEVDTTGTCKGFFRITGTNYCTHGPDQPPPGVNIRQNTPPIMAERLVGFSSALCDGDGVSGNRVEVLYVRASDRPNRYNQYLASIRQWAADMDQVYFDSAAETGGERRIRFVHNASCVIRVNHVIVSPTGDDDFGATIRAVEAQGYNRRDRKYVMFVDDNLYCGVANLAPDDQPGQSNSNNFGPNHSRIDNGCWSWIVAPAHELMHNLGGVQLSAPHTTGGYHCVDDYDLMCYSDEPYFPSMQVLCPDPAHESRLDCNHDDYYHTNPSPGTYLATHWNTANSQFLLNNGLPKPDLRPYTPSGYPSPVVPSSTAGTHEVTALYAGQTTYFDWHFINSGNAIAERSFHVELWVDDIQLLRYPYDNFDSGWDEGFDDWAEVIDVSGWHTVRLIADPDNTIAESDETNNVWEQQFYWIPQPADLIFADGFENDDFSLSPWSCAITDGGNLSMEGEASLSPIGGIGLLAVINDNHALYVCDNSPSAEPRYHVRFYFDPNTIAMANGNVHPIFYGYSGTSRVVLRAEFRFSSGRYQLRSALLNDGTTWRNSSWFNISDAPHIVELFWTASTAAGANNGGLTLFLDDVQRAVLNGVDNDTRRIDSVRLGAITGIDSGTRGRYYFDAFESRRQTHIGPVGSAAAALLAHDTAQAEQGVGSFEEETPEDAAATEVDDGLIEEDISKLEATNKLYLPVLTVENQPAIDDNP